MADKGNGKTGTPATAPDDEAQQVGVQVVAQYIRDLSFENPNVDKLMEGIGETPNLNLEVNVNANAKGKDVYESAIVFKAVAANKLGTIYDLEVIYAGLFRLQGLPQEALEPFLLINCPSLLFPFLRRLVADVTREGGFPPLLLDPIDFAGLYMRRRQEMAEGAGGAAKA
jgi:preprotein translocase subunit SecB